MTDLNIDIIQVVEIVREAGNLMMDRHLQIYQKGNKSNYVTSCDIAVQEYLTEKLSMLLPGSLVIGEENTENPSEAELLWVVDPIDGTSNFIRDIGISAISVGLVKNGTPYLGVIYQPYRDELFYAREGQGAYLNGTKIHVSDRDFAHAPKTFILKFCIGLITGLVAHKIGKISTSNDTKHVFKWTIIASVCGLLFNVIFDPLFGYFYKRVIMGKPAAEVALAWNITTTSVNAVISAIVAVIIYMALRPALKRANLFLTIGKKEK